MPTINIVEHQLITDSNDWNEEYRESLEKVGFSGGSSDFMQIPKYLGIDRNFRASYFIGTCWLTDDLAVAILPKIENVNFIKMFLSALEVDSAKESDYFAKCYKIDFDQPAIKTPKSLNILSPLLILHFISLLEKLVKRGLKRGYIIREENLKSKIKGKIMFSTHLRQNIFQKREDRVACRYQEYTFDIPENRLLKKALIFSEKVLDRFESIKKQSNYQEIRKRFNKLKQHFAVVSDDIEVSQIKKITANKLFINYKSAVKIAKMILRRFDYSIQKAGETEESTPPFYIDMSRLYELWVYSKLNEAYPKQIDFQVIGHCRTAVDFIKKDEKLIMDAKYKPRYANSNSRIIADIREISGYARDKKILKELNINENDNEEIKCVIIYPEPIKLDTDQDSTDNGTEEIKDEECKRISSFNKDNTIIDQSSKITLFRNFYKIAVPLPTE